MLFAINHETFNQYRNAFPVAFALTCAAMLFGLMLSINMVCKDYEIIKRELRMGVSVSNIIISKTLVIIILCAIISAILVLPFERDAFRISGLNIWFLYTAVFLTMVTSSEIGLLMSVFFRKKPQRATNSIPIIMLFQILFSGFIFEQADVESFRKFTVSSYSIRTIGSALRFDSERFFADVHRGEFENTVSHAIANFKWLILFFILAMLICILFLWLIDNRGWD